MLDNDFLDLVDEAHLTFKGSADGEIAFGALRALKCTPRVRQRSVTVLRF